MKLNRVLAVTTAILMCSTALVGNSALDIEVNSMVASADGTVTSGSLGDECTYSLDTATGTLTISGTGSTPNCSGGYSSIPWYSSRYSIKSIVVESGVTGIGDYTFYGCYYAESITLPDTLTSIGKNAFWNCSALTEVTIPSSVTDVSSGAFIGCSALTEITVASGNTNYTSIDGVLFTSDKTRLVSYPNGNERTEYTIPSSVTEIESGAFAGSKNLTKVTMPNSVTTVGGGVFYNCTLLTDVTLSNQITELPYYYQYFYVADWSGFFEGCSSLQSIDIPDSVTEIGAYAFSDCSSLTEFTVGDSVTTIATGAFMNDSELTKITLGKSVSSMRTSAVGSCYALKDIYVATDNATYSSIDGVLFNKAGTELILYPLGKDNSSYTVPTGVTTIDYGAFEDNGYIEKVTIPSTVTSIDSYAFHNVTNLATVDVEDISKVSIGNYAFAGTAYYDNSLTDDGFYITEDGILLGISSDVMDYTTIEVPSTVKYVSGGVFNYSCNAETIIFNSDCYLGTSAFYNCGNLTTVVVNGNCTTGYQAFYWCDNATTLTVNGNLTTTGDLDIYCTVSNVTHTRTPLSYDGVSTETKSLMATKNSYTIGSVEYSTYDTRTSYYTFGSVDRLQEVSDVDGNVYAVYGYKDVATMVSVDGNTVEFERSGYTLGCATIGDDNYLYLMWGKNISDDVISDSLDEENVVVEKYSLDGTLVGSLGLPVSYTEAQFPFDAGNANIAYNDGYIGLIFDTEWLKTSDGYHHQGSDFVLIDASTMEAIAIDTLSMSHSFGVTMNTNFYGFDILQLSDAGPRGVNLMRYYSSVVDSWSTPANDYTRLFHCSGRYGTNASQLDGNATYTYMGGFARSNSTYAVVGKSERVYTSDVYYTSDLRTYNYDVFVRIADATLMDSTSDDLAGVDRLDEATGEVADTNIVWLTQCNDTEKAGNVKIVTLPSGAYCVLWESIVDGEFDCVKYVILDECGNVLRAESTIGNARLSNTSIQPVVQGNTLIWAVADSQTNSIDFYSVDLEGDDSSVVGDVDYDGQVTPLDLLALKKYVLGVTKKSLLPNGDLNGDNTINVLDVLQLKNLLLNET